MNACRPPGAWQTYEITFRTPRFEAAGGLALPGRVSLIFNGGVVPDATLLRGRFGTSG